MTELMNIIGGRYYLKVALQVLLVVVAAIGVHRGALYAWDWFHKEPAPPDDAAIAVLTIPEEELDLGRVWEASSHEHVVHVTNQTDRPVTIRHFEKTCNCVTITPNAGTILAPHEIQAFTLRLGLSSRAIASDGMEAEPFRVRFAARYEGSPNTRMPTGS
jgi:hypothetical protein